MLTAGFCQWIVEGRKCLITLTAERQLEEAGFIALLMDSDRSVFEARLRGIYQSC